MASEDTTPREEDVQLRRVAVWVCDLCLRGEGGECHVPGCLFYLNEQPTSLPDLAEVLPGGGDGDKPPTRERGELWNVLDWSLWGNGMADTFRDPLADKMIAALTDAEFEQATALIERWHENKGDQVWRKLYEDQRDEIASLKAQLAEVPGDKPHADTPRAFRVGQFVKWKHPDWPEWWFTATLTDQTAPLHDWHGTVVDPGSYPGMVAGSDAWLMEFCLTEVPAAVAADQPADYVDKNGDVWRFTPSGRLRLIEHRGEAVTVNQGEYSVVEVERAYGPLVARGAVAGEQR